MTKTTNNTNTSVNANVVSDNKVITVEYETPKGYNTVDAIMWYQNNCLVGAPTIDGKVHEELMVGGVNEADVKAGIAAELKMIEMAGGDIWKGMSNLRTSMMTTLHNIKPTEQMTINDSEVMIDYNAKKMYLLDNTEIANLDDLTCDMPNEAIKALLVERGTKKLEEMAEEDYDYDDYDEYDEEE